MARSMTPKKAPETAKKSNSPGKGRAPQKAPAKEKGAARVRSTEAAASLYPAAPAAFSDLLYAHVMPADLEVFSANDRERIAASLWQLAHARKPGTINLRLFNPSPNQDGWTVDHTVLETVNDDMPFLVDSITGELQRRGLRVHFIAHPILLVRRDARGTLQGIVEGGEKPGKDSSGSVHVESFIHLQFDHCLDPAVLKDIEQSMQGVLSDVRAAVEDWPKMREKVREIISAPSSPDAEEDSVEGVEEATEFMRWLDNDNFTYLGYRDLDLSQRDQKTGIPKILPGSGLGILRDPQTRLFGGLLDPVAQSRQMAEYVRQRSLLVVTKTNARSHVHRTVPMDAVIVRRYDAKGNPAGESVLVGLFTSQSYSQSPRSIPIVRRKIEYVIEHSGLNPRSHDGKALAHILNNYPYDELFQIIKEDLFQNSLGILQLQERARTALFMRYDPFDRFATCLIYVPREGYDGALRLKIQGLLEKALGGVSEAPTIRLGDDVLARIFITIRFTSKQPRPDPAKLEADLRALCRTWADRLRDSLVSEHGEAAALGLLRRYGEAFPPAYRETVLPPVAVRDIYNLERAKALVPPRPVVDLSAPDSNGNLHLKLVFAEHPTPLSEALPLIEYMGLKVKYTAGPFEVTPQPGDKKFYIHEFIGQPAQPSIAEFSRCKPSFEEAFLKIWLGETEVDQFSALTLRAGMTAREITFMRTLARYLRQLRIPYGQEMMAATFLAHPNLALQVYALFFARHDPDFRGDRTVRCHEIEQKLMEGLGKIDALEEDRIIRRYINLVQSSLRTNYFQRTADGAPKPYISIKFDSPMVDFMPLPKPLYEIFVYSPRTEAIHLRGGKVARGGIRWSDRRDDFRNEILGLMKAQMVKNSVIVPVGSKGGFIVKKPPAEADKYQAEGIACYRIMMSGMLDITDNRVGSKIVPPERVVRHDGDDPYLVVAADKGTAKFSDIANSVSQDYKFWLDDAFASGGSAGYDHKQMGITARGAWEAVKRHFRELGKNIQEEDFTCVGVGDMSGDVFGNGMLLSKHIKLLGAIDHRHIFCDPNPDPAVSWAERQRMFNLPRSSWADYDTKKMSKGGGIFPRSEKTIKLTPEIRKAFGIAADTLTPAELIQVMLRSKVDLLYFGGIGTFVKASTETHDQVGDRSTESLRVDANTLRASVIGEGANLGMTQRGRVEFALKGGHLNTDAIDNSAGVDTSDHEVNIKIALQGVVGKGGLSFESRNKFLATMTDEVGRLVLRDNYLQTQALTVAEAQAQELLPVHVRCMDLLEKPGLLNRAVEFLPDGVEIAERQRTGKGLTRPELAVLLAYAKLHLYQQLLNSHLPDDDFMQYDLRAYFPEAMQKKYAEEINRHQLRREIIATTVTNSMINRAGSHFVLSMMDRTGKSAEEIVRAYVVTRESFGLRRMWKAIEAFDNKAPARAQTSMLIAINKILDQAVCWFLGSDAALSRLDAAIKIYQEGVELLAGWLEKHALVLNENHKKTERYLIEEGVPADLARRIAILPLLGTALDLTQLMRQSGRSMDEVAEIFFGIGQRLGFDWLAEHAHGIVTDTPRQREAINALLGDLTATQKSLTVLIVGKGAKGKGAKAETGLMGWLQRNAAGVERFDALLTEWRASGVVDLATLTLASRQLASLLV